PLAGKKDGLRQVILVGRREPGLGKAGGSQCWIERGSAQPSQKQASGMHCGNPLFIYLGLSYCRSCPATRQDATNPETGGQASSKRLFRFCLSCLVYRSFHFVG